VWPIISRSLWLKRAAWLLAGVSPLSLPVVFLREPEMKPTTREFVVHVVSREESARLRIVQHVNRRGIAVVAHATIHELVDTYDPDVPGCAIATCEPTETGALDVLEEFVVQDVWLPVIVVADDGDAQIVVNAMKSGAIDFITRPLQPERLVAAIDRAREVDATWRLQRSRRAELKARLGRLSPREVEVMRLVVSGMGNRQIAAMLSRSEKTIEVHRANAMRKMDASSLASLVSLVRESEQLARERRVPMA